MANSCQHVLPGCHWNPVLHIYSGSILIDTGSCHFSKTPKATAKLLVLGVVRLPIPEPLMQKPE